MTTHRLPLLATASATAALALALLGAAAPAEAGARRVVRPNAAGGTTAATLANRHGSNGGQWQSARGIATDSQGNAVLGGASRFTGPNGGTGQRAGRTQLNADGSASHASGFTASNARGNVQSSGSATRDAEGNVNQARSTTATSASTGNSVQSSTSYNSDTGRTRSTTCYNASGAVIACR